MADTDPVETLRAALAEADPPALAVACSGGLDSVALLHALATLPAARARGLRVLHVDHGLHPESRRWAEHVIDLAERLALPVKVMRCEVDRASGRGLEAAAREARYAALSSELAPGEWLAVAQHRDDQAETLLLRLLRASGTGALGAMRPLRRLGPGWLWRPLLALPRAALLRYARWAGIDWVDDPANATTLHDRNFLRHRVLPLLRERWSHADAALADSARLLAADAVLIDGLAERALAEARGLDPATLRVDALQALPAALRGHVLRRWLGGCRMAPAPATVLARIDPELIAAPADAEPVLRWAGARLSRYRDVLHVETDRAPLPREWRIEWDGRAPLALPTGDRLAFSTGWQGDDGFVVSGRAGGERIRLPGRAHRHALKKVLQSLGVPPWERRVLPLLWSSDGELLAAGDLVISARLDDALRQRGIRLRWDRPNNGTCPG